MEEFLFFHDFAMVVLTFIIVAVGLAMLGMLTSGFVHRGLLEAQLLECV